MNPFVSINIRDVKTQFYIVAVIIFLLFLGWFIFGRATGGEGGTLVEVTGDPTESILGRELLLSLERMRSIKLDVSFSNDPVFRSLEDFTIDIPDEPKGRRDPFAPI